MMRRCPGTLVQSQTATVTEGAQQKWAPRSQPVLSGGVLGQMVLSVPSDLRVQFP